jgi:hypothetical protein
MNRFFTLRLGVAVAALFSVAMARADAVVDWNLRCAQLVTEARLGQSG